MVRLQPLETSTDADFAIQSFASIDTIRNEKGAVTKFFIPTMEACQDYFLPHLLRRMADTIKYREKTPKKAAENLLTAPELPLITR